MTKRILNETEIALLKEHYPNGKRKLLAETLKVSRHLLRRLAKEHNVLRENKLNRIGTLLPLLSNTHESYYWLGMYVSDGYISKQGHFSLQQSEQDKDQVYKLGKFLNAEVKLCIVSDNKSAYPNAKNAYKVNIGHKEIGLKIKEMFKISDNLSKTYSGVSLDFMTPGDDKIMSFLIGVIDGDGHIRPKKFYTKIECHPSWYKTFKDLQNILPAHVQKFHMKLTNRTVKGKVKQYLLVTFGVKMTKILFDHAVKYNLPISERKWNSIKNRST